MPNTNSW